MARKNYLWNTQKELIKIGGIGDFGAEHQPREVSADVAHQYSTKEAKDAGWMVTWQENVPAPTPVPAPIPTMTPAAPAPSPPSASPTVAPTPKVVEPPKPEVHK